MKTVDLKEYEPDPSDGKLPEKITEMNIEIADYDQEFASLEFEEDLTEKIISYIEREIRGSFEYKKYINYLKSELDLTKCSLLPGIDTSNGAASLEFHHYPLNLYEITEIIGKKMISELSEDEKVSCFYIAEKVMEEHFRGLIGLVPLTVTLHQMAHNRSIIVPMSKVNGAYKKFVQKYNEFIPEDIKDRIRDAEMNSESDDAKLYNALKLEKNIANYNISYLSQTSDEDGGDSDEEEL